MRKTKIIATIGPKTAHYEKIYKLASLGMNIARLNMSHGDHAWHRQIIKSIKTINSKGNFSVAIMLDTKGAEIRTGDLRHEMTIRKGDEFTFTISRQSQYSDNTVEISYDGFISDVKTGDIILIDSGLLSFKVVSITQKNVLCECIDGGTITSRRHVNIKSKSASIPTITKQDWKDIDFGVKEGVDFIAVSFVNDAESILDLKRYLQEKNAPIDVVAKIESSKAINNLNSIIEVSDGVMVARGDLGAELPIEEIPLLQQEIVQKCRNTGKPVIVATHLLESMIVNPTPTRAEVSDITQVVMEEADAIMLSGETATGDYPFKSISVMDKVAERIEKELENNKKIEIAETGNSKIELARSTSIMANNLSAKAILVFTRRGYMATIISQCRPNPPVFAFTNMSNIRRRLNIYWGITALRIEFSSDPEKTIQKSLEVLKVRKLLGKDDRVIIVSDILAGAEHVETIQIRKIN